MRALGLALNSILISCFFTGFDDYVRTLTPERNVRNFWFKDYWQDMFNCNVVSYGKYHDRSNRWMLGPGGGLSPYDDGENDTLGDGSGSKKKKKRKHHRPKGNHIFRKTCNPNLRYEDGQAVICG